MVDQALATPEAIKSELDSRRRDYLTPIVLVAIGVLELGWVGLLGWGALWLLGF
jgi:hypothetical protein